MCIDIYLASTTAYNSSKDTEPHGFYLKKIFRWFSISETLK